MNRPKYKERLTRAIKIFEIWEEDGKIPIGMIRRVLDGHYNWYVTFSKSYGIATPEGYVEICGVDSQEEAEAVARQQFDGLVKKVVPEWSMTPGDYRKGLVSRLGDWDDLDDEGKKKVSQ